MKFGISIFPTHYSITPARIALEAERLGFESLWMPEHSHIPTGTVFPLGGDVPEHYRTTLDPFVALATAAAVTERIMLGTGVCLVVQRDPFNCAKEVATLDRLSGGRFLFGIGAGWNEPEMRNHGTDPSTRFRLMRERVEAMRAFWTQEEAEYHGRLVDFGPAWLWPKPVQEPHPPVLIGGAGPHVLQRVASYADGWLPILGGTPLEEFGARVRELYALAERAGRARPSVSVFGAPPDDATVEALTELGVERVILGVDSLPEAEALAQLEQRAAAVAALTAG